MSASGYTPPPFEGDLNPGKIGHAEKPVTAVPVGPFRGTLRSDPVHKFPESRLLVPGPAPKVFRIPPPSPHAFPRGCPFDFIPKLDSAHANFASVKYASCGLPADKNRARAHGAIVHYAASNVDDTTAAFHAYTDDEAWSALMKCAADNSELSLYKDAMADFVGLRVEDGLASLYGYSVGDVYNMLLKADDTEATSTLRLYGQSADVYATMATEVGKSFVYGYAASEVYNYTLAGDNAAQSTYLRLYGQSANVYATLATELGKSFLNLYNADAAHTIALATESTESFLRIGRDSGAEYASIQVENGESSLWFYDSGGDNLKYITGKLQLWQSSSTAAVYIELSDCSGKELRVREMEVCGGQHIRVLCSEPY